MSIPNELKENVLWCGWKREIRDGKPTKVPYNPQNLERAKPNDSTTFKSYYVAEDALLGGYVDGLGILIDNGYAAIDIDHCVEDGILSDAATDICLAMKCYAEKSPSGTGIRIIFKVPDNFTYDKEKYYIKNPNNGIEIYTAGTTNRFVTITGNTVYGYPVRENTEALCEILEKYMVRPVKSSAKSKPNFDTETHLDDEQIIDRAMRNFNFSSLFNGNMAQYNNDHSSADLALCNMLAFWTGKDFDQMDRIFKRSQLYREKWDRADYKKMTIDKAIADCHEVYDPYKPQSIWSKLDTPILQTDTWTVDANGISHTVVKNRKTGEAETIIVTSTPIAPAAYLENPETGDCKVEIHYMYNNQQRSCVCDKETILNKTKIVKLANKGINVTSAMANDLTKYFSDMESLNKHIPHYTSTSHVGWNGNNFVPYNGNIKFDGEDENAALYQAITQMGEFDDWVEYMKPLRNNLYFRLIMAASFASPLIHPCGCLPFWFHLWGASGTGKTVALMAAMSIWGDPKMGKLTRTLNATKNAMMSVVAFLSSIPFAGDELQTIKGSFGTYDELIMQLTEGVERNRMKYDKTLPNRYWNCAFLSTGEEPITADNNGGGTKNRVIEVEIDNKFFGRQGNAIVNFVTNNYGNAGVKYIEYVQTNFDRLKTEYQTIVGNVLSAVESTDKQASSASLMLLADKIACECIFKGETPLAIEDIQPFIKSNDETDVAIRAYNWLVDWIAKNENRFYSSSNYGEIWGKYNIDKTSILINSTVLKQAMVAEGFSFDAVKKKWADKGYINKYQNRFLQRCTIGDSLPYCVSINVNVEM